MDGPLTGIRIVDLSTVVMGPYATRILGDYGADIIKVEKPGGDTSRQITPMRNPRMGAPFIHLNRNKRSIQLDVRQPAGLEVLLKLVEDSDVFFTNIRPKALAKLGLESEALRERNPQLITVAMTGFGQDGRYAADPAYDDLVQGLCAVPSLQQSAGCDVPRYVPLAFTDRSVGLHAAIATLAAVVHRHRTGEGQAIEIPMFETMVDQVLGDHMGGMTFDPPNAAPGYMRLLASERRPCPTSDGYVCALIYSDRDWHRFAQIIGRPTLLQDDPRFSSAGERTDHADFVSRFVAEQTVEKSTEEWIKLLREADIPVAPLHTLESLFDDPHLQDVGFFQACEHPTEGRIRQMDFPSKWSSTPPSTRYFAPQLGEHSVEILAELGLDSESITELLESGVVGEECSPSSK